MEFSVCTRESRSCCCSIQGNSTTWSVDAVRADEREPQGDVAELDLRAVGQLRPLHADGVDVDAVQAALVLDEEGAVQVLDPRVRLGDRGLGEPQVVAARPPHRVGARRRGSEHLLGQVAPDDLEQGDRQAAAALRAAVRVGDVVAWHRGHCMTGAMMPDGGGTSQSCAGASAAATMPRAPRHRRTRGSCACSPGRWRGGRGPGAGRRRGRCPSLASLRRAARLGRCSRSRPWWRPPRPGRIGRSAARDPGPRPRCPLRRGGRAAPWPWASGTQPACASRATSRTTC